METAPAAAPRTSADRDIERIANLQRHMRSHPLLPPDPDNPRDSFKDVHSGVRLPTLHCAFAGCTWTDDVPMATHWDMEKRLFEHLRNWHAAEELREVFAHVQELLGCYRGLVHSCSIS